MENQHRSLTEGSIWKGILLFALPVFLGNVFQQLYNAFDAWCVGNYIGDDALAAVSSSGSLIFMMVSFFNGLSMGAGVVIARAFGAKQYGDMRKAIHTAIAFGLVTGALLTVAGVALTPTILRWMGTPAEVLPQSITYFRYYFCGGLFVVMYNIFVGILHAVGDSRHPLYYLIVSASVNVVLDLLFVAGLGNEELTADAIGPKTVQGLTATRHLRSHEGEFYRALGCASLSALAPGVLGQTGIETLEIVRGAVRYVRPDLVLVIDALASRSCARLASTVQISGFCETYVTLGSEALAG